MFVTDGRLKDLNPRPQQLGRDFGLNLKTPALQVQWLEQATVNQFVTGFHIFQVATVEDVGGQGHRPITVAHQPRAMAQVAHAVNGAGAILHVHVQQRGVILGEVFKVGILDDDHVAIRLGQGCAYSRPFAPIFPMGQEPDVIRNGLS